MTDARWFRTKLRTRERNAMATERAEMRIAALTLRASQMLSEDAPVARSGRASHHAAERALRNRSTTVIVAAHTITDAVFVIISGTFRMAMP